MNLFVYAELDNQQQTYLQSQLPVNIKTFFNLENRTQETEEAFASADLLFGNPPSSWFSNFSPAVKFWQLESAGFDQYQQIKVSGLVANMGDFFADACAETMVAGVLAFYRGLPTLLQLQNEKSWQGKQVRAKLELLSQKKAIVLGAGTIGKAVKRILEGFGTKVQLTARKNPAAQILSKEDLYQQLPETDLVINTLPGNLEKYVSEEFLQKMKKGSIYANVGRGNTTDETALLKALTSGHLAGAVLDVTEQEPLPENNPLWDLQNVILTQHTGGGQALEIEGKIDRFIQNLQLFLEGKAIPDKIDLNQGY